MTKLEIQVGHDLRSVAAEVATVWEAAAAGEPVQPSDRLIFVDWEALCAVLTSDRYGLLRALAAAPTSDMAGLAHMLGRDSQAVEADIAALVAIGLVLQDANGMLSAAADEITSIIRIAYLRK